MIEQNIASDGRAVLAQRRKRSQELRERYPFAVDMLRLYEALLDLHEEVFAEARALCAADVAPSTQRLCAFAAERVMPRVVDVTLVHGPQALAAAVSERWAKSNLVEIAANWMTAAPDAMADAGRGTRSQPGAAVDRYLARASLQPVLEVLLHISGSGMPIVPSGIQGSKPQSAVPDERYCPACGGLPQLAYVDVSNEALVSGRRHLLCARCSTPWPVLRMQCASCLEDASSKLLVFAEHETFPHVRIDACENCRRYLLTVNLNKDVRAVPLVDELAALPLDLFAQERGFTKLVPNMMGN